MSEGFTESVVEQAALAWLEATGWPVAHGPDIAPNTPAAERRDYREVVLDQRLCDALALLNPDLPADTLEDAFRNLTPPEGPDLIQRNRALHRLTVNGVTVEYRTREGEVASRRRKNVVQARSFAEMLEQTIRRYQNRAIEAAQVIEELIALAREMREANARGEALGLSEDELAFYDALETSDSAVKVLGDETLRAIARELVETVRSNVTIDWTLRENARAQMRVLVKHILRKHGYPPDKQEKATQTVIEQAGVLSAAWAMA